MLKKPERKRNNDSGFYTWLVVIILLTVIIIRPGFGQENAITSSSADYGIFESISDLHQEEIIREDDPDVIEAVSETLDSISTNERSFDGPRTGGLKEKTLDIPEALTKSPVIFDALNDNPIVNNTSILDWVLPPPASSQGAMNYLVLVRYNNNNIWKLGSIPPKLGLFTDSGLDKWIYIDVDGRSNTGDQNGNDIRVRMTFAKELLARDWEVKLFPPTLKFNNAGIKIEMEATSPDGGGAGMGGSIYFIKGISYSDKNYIWSVGFGLDEFMDSLAIRVQAKEWKAEPTTGLISSLIQGGLINIGDMNMLEIIGPFTLSYEFNTAPEEMDVFISVMRLEDQVLQDKAYVNIDLGADDLHSHMIPKGALSLGIKNMGSPIDSISWKAGENGAAVDSQSIGIRYTEFSEDLIDAHLSVPSLPGSLRLELDYKVDELGRNVTVLDVNVTNGIPQLDFLEVIYPKWGSMGDLSEWNATVVQLIGIPEKLHLETTAAVPFEVEDGSSSGLNVLDSFMTQIAGRFYRIGNIFREIPRAIAEMPSRKGSTLLDCHGDHITKAMYLSTSGTYMEGAGDMIIFYDYGGLKPSIFATVNGVSYYKGTFGENGNDITLGLHSTPSIDIIAISGDQTAELSITGLPEMIHILTNGENIFYEGSSNGEPSPIDYIGYRYRDKELKFDVDIWDIPSSLTMVKADNQIEVTSVSGSIGSIEMFTSNSTTFGALDIPERNFVSVVSGEDGASVGLRLNKFRSFVYNNATDGFIELNTVSEANFYAIIKDQQQGLDLVAAFVPLPSFTHIDVPSILDTPEISIPDIMGVRSITDYGDILFSLDAIGRAPLTMASSISQGLISAIGKYSTGLSLSWDLAEEGSTLDLILTLKKTGDESIEEAKWTHGIWMEQKGLGENSSVNGKIYLSGMPTKGAVNLSFSDKLISASIDFKDYSPEFDWLMVRTSGVQDSDISLYIKGIESEVDLLLDMMIYTDLSIGGRMTVNMNVNVVDKRGDPVDLGSMIATMIKAKPILSIRQMYLPKIPSELSLFADVENGVIADYSASKTIEYMYFKITKQIEDRWSQIYAIFHDLPVSFYVNMTPNNDFTIQEPFITQGLPSLEIKTSGREMDIFVEYDGSGFGQRGKFQIYADDLGSTTADYEGSDYVIDSEGIGYLSIQVDRLPIMEQFILSSLSLLGVEIEHVSISTKMIYGIFPQIILEDTKGGSFQIKVSGELAMEERSFSPDIFFITMRTTDLAGINIPTGLFISKDTSAINMERSDGAIVMPAPILTAWYWGISEITGGD